MRVYFYFLATVLFPTKMRALRAATFPIGISCRRAAYSDLLDLFRQNFAGKKLYTYSTYIFEILSGIHNCLEKNQFLKYLNF